MAVEQLAPHYNPVFLSWFPRGKFIYSAPSCYDQNGGKKKWQHVKKTDWSANEVKLFLNCSYFCSDRTADETEREKKCGGG